MPFVVDASAAAAWLMPDEHNSQAEIAFRSLKQDRAVAPSLWWFEIRNILVMGERRTPITQEEATKALALLSNLPIGIDHYPMEADLMKLVRRHRLTVYDAAYLELALREGLPLATLDAKLMVAARAEGVALLGA